jgi:Ser-tRNA(Ala) deacylase AlaX
MGKRFRAEPYLTEADATVTRVQDDDVWLDDPILFAFSGGQQGDRGTIAGLDVLDSEAMGDGTIRYRLPPDHGLAEGDRVAQVVDRELRLRIMRVHTATHVAYSAMSEQMGEARETIGSNVHAGKGRLDWEFDSTVTPWVAAAAERVAEIVARDLPIRRFAEPDDPDRWVWQIEGDDLDTVYWRMPCGGTHLARSGEVGRVKLKRKNIGKGKERIEVSLLD